MARLSKPSLFRNCAVIAPDSPSERLTDLDTEFVRDAYRAHGAVLFRGFTLDLDAFRATVDAHCTHPVINDSGGRHTVDEGAAIQTVNLGGEHFMQHPELSREPWRPDVCWFGCFTPPARGGETTICDGTMLVRAMPADLRAQFEGRRLVYRQRATAAELAYWLGSEEPSDALLDNPPADCCFSSLLRKDGEVYRFFSRPAIHKPMFSDDPCWGNFLIFNRHHNRSQHPSLDDGSFVPDATVARLTKLAERLRRPVKWRKGDLLMLDNSRFTHGRNRVRDAGQRDIYTYFGFLEFAIPDPEEGAAPRWRDPARWQNVPTAAAENTAVRRAA